VLIVPFSVLLSVLLTAIYARRRVASGFRPSVYVPFLISGFSAIVILLAQLLYSDGAEVFTGAYWDNFKFGGLDVILGLLGVLLLITFTPTVLIVAFYQWKFRARQRPPQNLKEIS
jgi:hypothetical protein